MSILTAGRSTAQDCDYELCSGGISDDLYLANNCEVTSVQIDEMTGKATGITMVTDKVFFAFDFRDFSAQFTETVTVDDDTKAVSVEQNFEMAWPCRNHDDRTRIMEMARNAGGMIGIHGENTGIYWIWGYLDKRRAYLATNEGTSGAVLTDANQELLTIRCRTTEKAIEWEPGAASIPL